MKEILTFSAALLGSYAAFMGVLVLFGRLFFPFYTKEQLERMNALGKPKTADKRREISRKAIAQLNLRRELNLERYSPSKFARS